VLADTGKLGVAQAKLQAQPVEVGGGAGHVLCAPVGHEALPPKNIARLALFPPKKNSRKNV